MANIEKDFVLAHEPDAAWIIALYKAIHGGDPAPQLIAASVIAAMAPHLNVSTGTFGVKQLEAGFGTLGVKVTQQHAGGQENIAISNRPRQYCFTFHGVTICITFPTVEPPPPPQL